MRDHDLIRRGLAVVSGHDRVGKLNKPPRFDGPCSSRLTAALEEALALLTEKPHDRA